MLAEPHYINAAPDGSILVADRDAHQVLRFDGNGKLLQALGKRHWPSLDAPFNHPTAAAQAADGEIYVADGYGNSSVHRFAADGTLIATWGGPGAGPGAFTTPHAIWVDRFGKVLVGDRENNRVQVFDRTGAFLAEWGDFYHPMQIWVDDRDLVFVTDQIPRISLLERRRQADRPLPRRHQRRARHLGRRPGQPLSRRAAAAGNHQAGATRCLDWQASSCCRSASSLPPARIRTAGRPCRAPTPRAPSRSAFPMRGSLPTAIPALMIQEGRRALDREMATLRAEGKNPTRTKLPPAYYLAVSGGGDNGAFGAGLLNGWTETGYATGVQDGDRRQHRRPGRALRFPRAELRRGLARGLYDA